MTAIVLGALVAGALYAWPRLASEAEEHEGPPPETFSATRSQSVTRGAPPRKEPPPPEAPPKPNAHPTVVDRGPLCDRLYEAASARVVQLPSGQLLRKAATGGKGGWVWVNLWAAWCEPCKAEMPLLEAWAERNPARLVLLSIDDDRRQLDRFMAKQGTKLSSEVRWIPEGEPRAALFAALGLTNPALPVQALFDPEGRLRCVREGSITNEDLDEAAHTFLH